MRARRCLSRLLSRLAAAELIVAASCAIVLATALPGPVGVTIKDAVFRIQPND